MKFRFPGAGDITVTRHGKVNDPALHGGKGYRYRYFIEPEPIEFSGIHILDDFRVTRVLSVYDSLTEVLADACRHAEEDYFARVSEYGSPWYDYIDDLERGRHGSDTATKYRISGVLRVQSWSYAGPSDTYTSLWEVFNEHQLGHFDGPVDVYRDDDDEPTWRLTEGPRGGMNVEKW